ncbi:MAG TPA: hypothetical protein VJB02_00940 [Coxiellaceae bacterium]|nr:hypothetical protein [Coxiellaceae bacterium]
MRNTIKKIGIGSLVFFSVSLTPAFAAPCDQGAANAIFDVSAIVGSNPSSGPSPFTFIVTSACSGVLTDFSGPGLFQNGSGTWGFSSNNPWLNLGVSNCGCSMNNQLSITVQYTDPTTQNTYCTQPVTFSLINGGGGYLPPSYAGSGKYYVGILTHTIQASDFSIEPGTSVLAPMKVTFKLAAKPTGACTGS